MEEHKSHCPQCPFVKYGAFESVTRRQAIEIECQRFRDFYEQLFAELIKRARDEHERRVTFIQEVIDKSPQPSLADLSASISSTANTSASRPKRTRVKRA